MADWKPRTWEQAIQDELQGRSVQMPKGVEIRAAIYDYLGSPRRDLDAEEVMDVILEAVEAKGWQLGGTYAQLDEEGEKIGGGGN